MMRLRAEERQSKPPEKHKNPQDEKEAEDVDERERPERPIDKSEDRRAD
jgi:hypothetical protein